MLVIYQYKTPVHTDSSHYSGCVFLIKGCCFASKYIEVYFFSPVSLIVDSILSPVFSLPPPLAVFLSLPPTTFFRPVSHFHLLFLSHPVTYPSLLTISG